MLSLHAGEQYISNSVSMYRRRMRVRMQVLVLAPVRVAFTVEVVRVGKGLNKLELRLHARERHV